jgi:hypothetical protein
MRISSLKSVDQTKTQKSGQQKNEGKSRDAAKKISTKNQLDDPTCRAAILAFMNRISMSAKTPHSIFQPRSAPERQRFSRWNDFYPRSLKRTWCP